MNSIRPSSDLRNKYNEISTLCKETNEPIYITVNGRGDTVIMSIEEYNQQQAELELLRNLAESGDDYKNNRIAPIQDSFDSLRLKLLKMQKGEI